MNKIDCKKYAQEILDKVKESKNKKYLSIITVGHDPASESYVKGKKKDCEYCGIECKHYKFEDGVDESQIKDTINNVNDNDDVTGVIIQLPLPKGYDEKEMTDMVRVEKDVDGFNPKSAYKPCTPEGIVYVLKNELGSLMGKNALIVGRGKLVGRPLFDLLLAENCTVTMAHSKTINLVQHVKNADIIVCATGKYGLLKYSDFNKNQIVIDAGITRGEDGKLHGDIEYDVDIDGAKITPVPGGIGLMTRAVLMAHVAGYEL